MRTVRTTSVIAAMAMLAACKKDPPPPPEPPPATTTKPSPINVLASAEPDAATEPSARFPAQLVPDEAGAVGQGASRVNPETPEPPEAALAEVAIGALVSTAPIDNKERVMAAARARFRQCYRRGIASGDKATGTMKIVITISKDGDVAGVEVVQRVDVSPKLEPCVARVGRTLQFDKPTGGEGARLTVPLTFSLKKSP